MKKHLMICSLLFFTTYVFAKEDECPSAVDAAEAQNPNAYKDCDYSKTGLNGVLHRALSGKAEKSDEGKDPSVKEPADKNESVADVPVNTGKGEFSSAQQLSTLRFSLLGNAAIECPKGFMLDSERYLPITKKTMKLELVYRCL